MKYIVFAGGEQTETTKSKKSTAVDAARAIRDELKTNVEVRTEAGATVFELAAPKKIKMSPRYTRVVAVPEGVTVPDGLRLAYVRPRVGLGVVHDPSAEKGKQYALFNLKTSKVQKTRFATTRAAGEALVAAGVAEPVTA